MRINASSSGGKAGVGCSILFALPFFLFGIGAGAISLQHFTKPGGMSDPASWFLLVFHLIFTGIGIGIPFAAIRGSKEAKARDARMEENSDCLWLMRDDWASGRIDHDAKGAVWVILGFAGFWNLISWPAAYGAITQEVIGKGNKEALLVLLFPLVGIGLGAAVVHAFLKARRYGKSRFVMEQIPAVIGTVMRGIVVTGVQRSLAADRTFLVKLTCYRRRVTGSGKNRNVSMTPLWYDEKKFKGTPRRDDPALVAVPVAFAIPSDTDSVTLENPNNRILWQLKVSLDVPGVDYDAEFELPVFRTPDSPESGAPVMDDGASNAAFETREEASEARTGPSSRGITMTRPVGGAGIEFRFAPLRNIGPVIGLIVFEVIWGGAVWFMIEKGAPIFFPIIFGGIFLLLIAFLFSMITTAGKAIAANGRLSVIRGPFGLGAAKEIRADEVTSINVTMGMQSGQTHYFDLAIRCKDGKKIKVVTSVKDKAEAEWIAEKLAVSAGLGKDVVRAGRGRARTVNKEDVDT